MEVPKLHQVKKNEIKDIGMQSLHINEQKIRTIFFYSFLCKDKICINIYVKNAFQCTYFFLIDEIVKPSFYKMA